jgi:N-acetylmuramic acid 6-phosphate etherase
MPRSRWARLATEHASRASRALDRLSPLAIARLMNREDRAVLTAVGRALPAVAAAVELIVAALGRGGRLFFVGAGTSGRLGVLEAAECPPTFGTPPGLVQAIMAGGRPAVFRSREGVEDDARAAARTVRARVRAGDVVVGVSASGVTPFARAALAAARRRGAATVLVACNPLRRARAGRRRGRNPLVIGLDTGPEVLAGSTRLKAGTATKLVLNTLTTASMARLGRVYGNRMVDLQPRSAKLRDRALRLIQEVAGVPQAAAARALDAAGNRVRLALVMAGTGLPAPAARRALRAAGSLRAVLDGTRPGRRRVSAQRRRRR